MIWVSRTIKNKETITIGKIKKSDVDNKASIMQLDSTNIKVRLTDTRFPKGDYSEYIIDLNNKIEPNDGSPYAINIHYNR